MYHVGCFKLHFFFNYSLKFKELFVFLKAIRQGDIGVSVTTKASVTGLTVSVVDEGIDFTSDVFIALLSCWLVPADLAGLCDRKDYLVTIKVVRFVCFFFLLLTV